MPCFDATYEYGEKPKLTCVCAQLSIELCCSYYVSLVEIWCLDRRDERSGSRLNCERAERCCVNADMENDDVGISRKRCRGRSPVFERRASPMFEVCAVGEGPYLRDVRTTCLSAVQAPCLRYVLWKKPHV